MEVIVEEEGKNPFPVEVPLEAAVSDLFAAVCEAAGVDGDLRCGMRLTGPQDVVLTAADDQAALAEVGVGPGEHLALSYERSVVARGMLLRDHGVIVCGEKPCPPSLGGCRKCTAFNDLLSSGVLNDDFDTLALVFAAREPEQWADRMVQLPSTAALAHKSPEVLGRYMQAGLGATPLPLKVAFHRMNRPGGTAAAAEDADILRLVLDPQYGVHIDQCVQANTLLSLALTDRPDLLDVLLELGADPTVTLGAPLRGTPFHVAVRTGVAERLERLLRKHPLPTGAYDRTGFTPLMHAAQDGAPEMLALLLAAGAKPDEVGGLPEEKMCREVYRTAIHVAAGWGGEAAVATLRTLFEAVEVKDVDLLVGGCTPLMAALQCGTVDAVQYLLAEGADAAAVGTWNLTPLLAFAGGERPHDSEDTAARIAELLFSHGAASTANVAMGNGATALIAAAGAPKKRRRLMELLLVEGGADPNCATRDGATALFLAARAGCLSTAELLLAHGARPDVRHADGTSLWAATEPFPALRAALQHAGGTADPEADDPEPAKKTAPCNIL
eukprot:TRINITY_DN12237_c0_g1_i1.p1 TRINITY_DN12237_c0_g1~~TRINITY_DN12237_c0_g1_i1.p1  ORF type:complete len:556 (+),score=134.56 TRINITY_DN12237_c0_g1_i1:113-1780(+)